jgi:HEAT repeat protein
MTEPEQLTKLVELLASDDATVRMGAREKLVEDGGHQVVRALVSELLDHRDHVRWEAAKALHAIADPAAASALLNAIDDNNEDVRWVASEGVIALKRIGMLAVLHGLIRRSDSPEFCKSAHHILRELQSENPEVVATVLAALSGPEPPVSTPIAALKALQQVSTHT